jgi:hypothetical protein
MTAPRISVPEIRNVVALGKEARHIILSVGEFFSATTSIEQRGADSRNPLSQFHYRGFLQ